MTLRIRPNGSSDDDLWQVDATQLKRNAFVIACSAFTLASASEADVPRLTALVLGGAHQRLGRESEAAMNRLMDETAGPAASRYKDAVMLLDTAAWRESGAIESLKAFADQGGPGSRLIGAAGDQLKKLAAARRTGLDAFYQQALGQKPELLLSEEEKQAAGRIPVWKAALLDLLTEKLKLAGPPEDLHGHYIFEINNLIDGRRSTLDIYRLVRAAALSAGEWYYGPVDLGDTMKYLEGLEKSGAIAFQAK